MTNEPWNKHTPGDPMPCKCEESVVEVRTGALESAGLARYWYWGRIEDDPEEEITDWRFVERKGEDVIAADPYDVLEWDEDGIAIVVLKVPSQPEWMREDDLVRFDRGSVFSTAASWAGAWATFLAFQIKRRPVLTPAEPQLLAVLADATDDEADAIRQAARRANIEVPG